MDSFSRLIAIILAGILLFLYPLQYIAFNKSTISDNHIHSLTKELMEEVMYNGILTIDMYETYMKKLGTRKKNYEINLIHSKALIGYEESKSNTMIIKNGMKEESYGNHKMLNKNTEDKLRITYLYSSVVTSNNHSHTSDCFSDFVVKHTHEGNQSSGGGCYGQASTNQSICGSYSYSTLEMWTWTCNACGYAPTYIAGYDGKTPHYTSQGLCTGSMSVTNVSNQFRCSSCGNSKQNPFTQCSNYITRTSYSINCGKEAGQFYVGGILKSPICHEVVTKIAPTNPTQTVIHGENIISTVQATFLDGQSRIINVNNNYSRTVGSEVVALTYSGLISNGKTRGTLSTTITIQTLPNRIPLGLLIIPSATIVQNGTEPSYEVYIQYDNGDKEITRNYIKTGFTKGAGMKTVVFNLREDNTNLVNTIVIEVKRNTNTCQYGHSYELDDFDGDHGCNQCANELLSITAAPNYMTLMKGDDLKLILTGIMKNGQTKLIHSGWESNYDKNKLGEQEVIVSYEGRECMISVIVVEREEVCSVCNTRYIKESFDDNCPICREFVIGIEVIARKEKYLLGEHLEILVKALYRDGSTGYVEDWTSNYNAYRTGEQIVNIYHNEVLTTVTVMVWADFEEKCNICNSTYNRITYPNGCPICSNVIERIEVRLKGGGRQVQLNSQLNLEVILIFLDGHREFAADIYRVESYEANKLGYQNIEVIYNEHTYFLEIQVVNTFNTRECINGHTYFLNDDASDPGCNICVEEDASIYEEYFQCIYTNEILNILYSTGVYQFDTGDYITITMQAKESSIFHMFNFFSNEKVYAKYTYGGMIIGKYI